MIVTRQETDQRIKTIRKRIESIQTQKNRSETERKVEIMAANRVKSYYLIPTWMIELLGRLSVQLRFSRKELSRRVLVRQSRRNYRQELVLHNTYKTSTSQIFHKRTMANNSGRKVEEEAATDNSSRCKFISEFESVNHPDQTQNP